MRFLCNLWRRITDFVGRIPGHFRDFWVIWLGMVCLAVSAIIAATGHWEASRIVAICGLGGILLILLWLPMNAVYGLIGTSGSVGVFFVAVIFISFLFSGIYYLGFYRNAGVCYDVNQTHIKFDVCDSTREDCHQDTVYIQGLSSETGTPFFVNEERHYYQDIGFWYVFRNTVMTSLMQEPSDLFAATVVYNEGMYQEGDMVKTDSLDRGKATLFHWILILQILISWILLGVFISILYNKFRYES